MTAIPSSRVSGLSGEWGGPLNVDDCISDGSRLPFSTIFLPREQFQVGREHHLSVLPLEYIP